MPSAEKTLKKRIAQLLTALSALITALLLVSVLLTQIQLIKANNEALSLREELEELRDENTRLTVEYESVFSTERIEKYAREVLGMQRAFSERVEIIDTPVEDKIIN